MAALRRASARSAHTRTVRFAGCIWRFNRNAEFRIQNSGRARIRPCLHSAFCILNVMRTLRVGIDGRAFSSPAPGIRRYVEGLVPALLALEDAPEVVALGGLPSAVPPQIPRVAERLHPPTNAGWTLVGLPRAAADARVDVLHAPAYT